MIASLRLEAATKANPAKAGDAKLRGYGGHREDAARYAGRAAGRLSFHSENCMPTSTHGRMLCLATLAFTLVLGCAGGDPLTSTPDGHGVVTIVATPARASVVVGQTLQLT